ncbi:MAG: hypothetical protein ACREUQ_06730, partial [Burkholderiales bacterium]
MKIDRRKALQCLAILPPFITKRMLSSSVRIAARRDQVSGPMCMAWQLVDRAGARSSRSRTGAVGHI